MNSMDKYSRRINQRMKTNLSAARGIFIAILLFSQISCACSPTAKPPAPKPTYTPVQQASTATTATTAPTTSPVPTAALTATTIPQETADLIVRLLSLISQKSMFSFLEGLTNIQPYSGWRSSATTGESEALSYVTNILTSLTYLQDLGMELERQSFQVPLASEQWENRLYLSIKGLDGEVPANAPRGHRYDVVKALRFDSDGQLNDSEQNPVEVTGEVVLVYSVGEINELSESEASGKIVFLDSAVIGIDLENKRSTTEKSCEVVDRIVDKGVAGLVVVTHFSTMPMGSQGKMLGDGVVFEGLTTERRVPVLYVRLEDLASAGISSWEDLAQIESARLVWDADVFSPGTSGNLVARIPGTDTSQAIILGAHIDSANSPGAMDNGINAVALLEVARILNEAQTRPPVDIYLAWFGSEEIGLFGSQYYVTTHQELLDHTTAALLMDDIIVSTPGPTLVLDGWSHSVFGNSQLVFPEHLAQLAALQGITIDTVEDQQGISSDNSIFSGFVTQAGFASGSIQGDYAHSPYDTVEVAQGLGDLMQQVTSVVLMAAMETDPNLPGLHVTPKPDRRALIVASHTENVHMTPTMLINLDRSLAWEGFDVDMIPYGQAVTSSDFADTDLVIVLPVTDYPSAASNMTIYDEAWSEPEIEELVTYVEQGGLLVLTNSANQLWFGTFSNENEDWHDVNPISIHFGIVFEEGRLFASEAQTQQEHPLTQGQQSLAMLTGNPIPFSMQSGETLAGVADMPVIGLVDFGTSGGQVLVLADVGILGYAGTMPEERNLTVLRNLAQYALKGHQESTR